jgi:hypothetical protein
MSRAIDRLWTLSKWHWGNFSQNSVIVKLIQINEKKVTRENLFLSGKIKNFHFKSGKPTQIEIVNLWENCTKYISTKTEGKKLSLKKRSSS